jgi:YfiH family protein
MLDESSWIPATWNAPGNIIAGCTTRLGGISKSPYDSLNLGMHVGDNSENVQRNRDMLAGFLHLPATPQWLEQVHGCQVSTDERCLTQADASMTTHAGSVCVVMTADCLPLLVTDRQGTCIAAIHAGWRGLANGVISHTIQSLPALAGDLLVWMGPAIGPNAFEVGQDVYECFMQLDVQHATAFRAHQDKWLLDIYAIARQQLRNLGVTQISGGEYCTYQDASLFYSYRRDKQTGRMASLIWMT